MDRRAPLVTAARALAGLAIGAAALVCGATASAQKLYQYTDANGVPVYTDRPPPSGQAYDERDLERRFERPEIRLYRRNSDDRGVVLVASNTYYAPVQLKFHLAKMTNVGADVPSDGWRTLPPRAQLELLVVSKEDPSAASTFEYEFAYMVGDPDAEHAPDRPYRLPYAIASSVQVSQAYPSAVTHRDAASLHAIDFVMPVGTQVFAARGGTVIEVASDFHDAGLDPEVDGPRANIIRVLHDDGTMSLYAHLNWNSIRVTPGKHVERGEYLADSGNTGFTTGPHLHFVVQRNREGTLISVPVQFAGADGGPITVKSGQRYTAH
jgi:murein DD-endopeptidase MepM/ murein hydrolase activator NlpD